MHSGEEHCDMRQELTDTAASNSQKFQHAVAFALYCVDILGKD